MSTPFISIIIPTYNSSKTIAKCLDSITGQTFTNFELIIADGSSSDNTLEIVKQYKKLHTRFTILSEKDKGIYDAMNKGISAAGGVWIYFLGSDDWLLNHSVLEDLARVADFNQYDFVYGNVSSPEYGEQYDGEFDQQKILHKNICHQALFVRKDLFKKLGKFNTRYIMQADYDFNLRCMFNKKVRKKHVDLMIAYYAPAGSSSTIADKAFLKDKNWLLLKYGFASFSWKERFQLLRQVLK